MRKTSKIRKTKMNNTFQHVGCTESTTLEFKTSLFYVAGISVLSCEQMDVITRTISSMMNQEGGKLFLGVNDKGFATNSITEEFQHLNDNPAYQNNSYPSTTDGYKRFILDWVAKNLGNFATTLLSFDFQQFGSVTICVITIKKSNSPVWFKGTSIYVRADASTRQLRGHDITDFIMQIDKNAFIQARASDKTAFKKRVDEIKKNTQKTGKILVIYPNGDFIHEKSNRETLLGVIHRAGIKDVMSLGLTGRAGKGNTPYVPFIGEDVYIDNPSICAKTQNELDGYMVFTKYSTGDIIAKLNQISNGLDLGLMIEVY